MNDTPDKNIIPLPNASMQRRMILLGLVILLAGMVIGAAITTIITRRQAAETFAKSEFIHKRTMENLQRRLNLTNKQVKNIKPVYKKHMEALKKIQQQARPLIQKELKEMHEEISLQLTEEQKQRWKNQINRLQRKFYREHRRRKNKLYGTIHDYQRFRNRGEDRKFRRRRRDRRPSEPNQNIELQPQDPALEPDL